MDEIREQHAAWCKSLGQAIQADAWGQVLEAVEAYERLGETLELALPQCHALSSEQQSALGKTARSVDARAKCLSSVDGERDTPTKDDMEHILDALRDLLSDDEPVFPLDMAGGSKARATAKSSTVQVVEADDAEDNELLDDYTDMNDVAKKPLNRIAGATYLDIQIAHVGLKDATVYVNPTIVVSVYDKAGKRLEETIETAVGANDEPQHISFRNATVRLETSLETMQESGAAVFFEFYHYKPKKRKKSCRCWALLEMDEVPADGGSDTAALALELYQKPMDPKRKRINLFTVKELFLHIQVHASTAH